MAKEQNKKTLGTCGRSLL